MTAHLRYLSYVIRHKWFVLVAGIKVGAPLWRLLVHDWSKFLPREWFAYARYFYGSPPSRNPMYDSSEFYEMDMRDWKRRASDALDVAWLHHQKANAHHWQYWVLMEDNPSAGERYRALPMPMPLVREMVADWMGAGRALTGRWEVCEWYAKNAANMVLHPSTRARAEMLILPAGGRL
jgi:hypothetical protein